MYYNEGASCFLLEKHWQLGELASRLGQVIQSVHAVLVKTTGKEKKKKKKRRKKKGSQRRVEIRISLPPQFNSIEGSE